MNHTDQRERTPAPRSQAADLLERAAPLLFVLLWSSSFLGTRIGLRHMSPLWFVAVRMMLAAAIMVFAMTASRRPWSLTRADWFHCAVVGVSTQSILLMTAHVAMTHTEAAPIALIQTLNPLLSAMLAWPLLGERMRPVQIVGLFLGFAGVLLILGLAALNSRAELSGLLGIHRRPSAQDPPSAPASPGRSARSTTGGFAERCRRYQVRPRSFWPERLSAWQPHWCWKPRGPTGIPAHSPASPGTRSPSR